MTTLPPAVDDVTAVAPTAPDAKAKPGTMLATDRACIRCSYNLRGLPMLGKCPECGTPVADSLRGILLQFASPEYLKAVHSGLSLILNGILLMIVLNVASMLIGMGMGAAGVGGINLVIAGLGLIPSVMLLLGYWRFTEPDPGFVGSELPTAARRVMRVAVAVQAIATAVTFVMQLGAGSVFAGGTAPNASSLLALMLIIAGLTSLVAWVVQFFATMRYTRWVASRVPDAHIIRRTRTYMWLLPVVAVVGAFLIAGPLIALVMYWNLLDRLRKQVKAIRSAGVPAVLKGSLG